MYILEGTREYSLCPKCGKELKELHHKELPDGYPAFEICFRCQDVTEIKGDEGQKVIYRNGKKRTYTKQSKDDKPTSKALRRIAYAMARKMYEKRKPFVNDIDN
jgi:hypothetical protein